MEKIERLEEIGDDWDPMELVGETTRSDVLSYKAREGHCNMHLVTTRQLPMDSGCQMSVPGEK
jgi:hypothetical protein